MKALHIHVLLNNKILLLNLTPQNHIGTKAVDFLLIYLQHPYYNNLSAN